jgi:hypothetical protein
VVTIEPVLIASIVAVVEVLTVGASSAVTLTVEDEATEVVRVVAVTVVVELTVALTVRVVRYTGSRCCNCGSRDANAGTSTGIFYSP